MSVAPGTDAPVVPTNNLKAHGRALAGIGIVSGVGILATAGFQFVCIRGLGPSGYSLLASLLAFLNVISIGSSALRNSVAVGVAEDIAAGVKHKRRRFLDGGAVEALVLGGICVVAIAAAAPVLAGDLQAGIGPLLIVALSAVPYFLFSRAQGLLQGAGRSTTVVLWSTGAQVAQFILATVVVLVWRSAVGVIVVLLVIGVLGSLGAGLQAGRHGLRTGQRAFTATALVVILLTVVFTWLTSIDVVLVRSEVSAAEAGAYAAAATLIKTTLIVPATLSLYLLPRFVGHRTNASLTKLGVNVTLGLAALAGLAMAGVVALWGSSIVLVFGGGYGQASELLVPLALAWIPWTMAQSLLIRITAASSRVALALLVVIAAVQWGIGRLVLPDLHQFIAFNAGVGAAALAVLYSVHLVLLRKASRATSDLNGKPAQV